ncbi:MAG: peptidoglycan-binding protein [Terracidiphilus sp.]|jgi:hypothetical protein
MNQILKTGSRGEDVRALQTQLNAKLRPSPGLTIDGSYGTATRNAVVIFQRQSWLVEDGEAGPCTWNALMETEDYAPILHRVHFLAQPNRCTCWAASTAMITSTIVPVVIARTPSDLVMSDGSLANFSDTSDPVTGAERFARANSLVLAAAAVSIMPRGLVSLLRHGPLMFDMLWNSQDYSEGAGSPGHMITVVGIRGDNDASGKGTTLRINDPWPPHMGRIYSVGFFQWIQEVPTRTYHVYQRA